MFHSVEELKAEATKFLKVRAVWRFFEAERAGNSIRLFEPGGESPIETLLFGRQAKSDGLCLSEYVMGLQDGRRDQIAMFVVSAGEGIRGYAEAAKERGEYLKAHGLQALAIETAEGCAEWLHRRIREDWGLPRSPGHYHP